MRRQEPGRVLSEHAGVVELPFDQVRDVMLSVKTGALEEAEVPLVIGGLSGRSVTVSGGPTTFTAQVGGVPLTIEVDRETGWVQARGQWWCGRFQVEEHPGGAVIKQRTYTCATGAMALVVPFTMGCKHQENGHRALLQVLGVFEKRFGARTRFLSAG